MHSALIELYWTQLIVFALVALRVGGMVFVAPAFGSPLVSWKIRAALALAIALLVAPVQAESAADLPAGAAGLVHAAAREMALGIALGLGVRILLSAAQIIGGMIAQMSGMGMAQVLDTVAAGQIAPLSQFYYWLALAVYLGMGGHRLLVTGILETFAAMPPGQVVLDGSLADALSLLMTQAFTLAVRGGAPVAVALLLATLMLALLSRTAPHLSAVSVGLSLNAVSTWLVVFASLAGFVWLWQQELGSSFGRFLEVLLS